ncbi:angiogenic factor with G patch and FHA domains 1 isoform X2 [Gadus macrocephalus]|uniref:angiogenic factor with G patch and FHA domains 1 isoform X2 n=1 Tax=Gadus macrocephalus TaxID=80720 RepID=UPI0028CBADC3|nr:angiogenic factor with G patch and FHA domains 1 isoform X2 [Gadus macrocephalus]
METPENNVERDNESGVAELQLKVEFLKQELHDCRAELAKLQKQLSHSERLQKNTDNYNEDLRKQVDQLSAEIHQRKKKDKDRIDCETQTEEYTWSETDYYNYYYGNSYENTEATDVQGPTATAGQDPSEANEAPVVPAASEAVPEVTVQPDTHTAPKTEGGEGGSIADMLRATAEQAMTQTGFVFDETTGMYYDHSTKFYYDSASQLYYDNNTGIYYCYDAESGRYQFHSKIEVLPAHTDAEPGQDHKPAERKGKTSKKGTKKASQPNHKVQELTSSLANMKISSYGNTASYKAKTDIWPPCVRVTVVRSPVLQVGTLFIITADAQATIGREKDMDHAIRIAEMGVSKCHAVVYFDQDQQCYMLVDQGSQNGTVLNGNRILQPKIKCEPCALTHGDEVKMGETVLSFHIHSGTDTCDGCEPGQVMAHLSKHKRAVTPVPIGPIKEEKEVLRQKELRQMKAKYGLKSSEFEEAKALKNPRYQDRAESRRQTVGSDGTFQRDDAPASVHVEISDVNKGRKMLEKMGWKRGDGLGKQGKGMKDPIQLKVRKSKSGLGAGAVVSAEDAALLAPSRSSSNWQKARERFADTCQPGPPVAKERSPKAWLKAEDPATTDPQPEDGPPTQGSG